jgi:hypothetical protein
MNDDATLNDAKLQELARHLGAQAAERIDVERTAATVVARLRAEQHAPRRLWGQIPAGWLRIAAALVLLAGAGIVARGVLRRPPAGDVAQTEMPDLGDLSADQLRALLNTVSQPAAVEPVSAQEVGLEDLTPQQLRALLASLEA